MVMFVCFSYLTGWLVCLGVSRHGKRYETEEEMKLRFAIFSESLDLIRSTNKKGLPYTLGLNRKSYLLIRLGPLITL